MRVEFRWLLAFPLLLPACAVQMQLKEAPIPGGSIAKLQVTDPVAVRPLIVGGTQHTLVIPGPDVTVDEDQFSSALVDRILEELRAQSVPVDPAAARSIELQVVRVSIQPDRTIFCVIDFNRRLADGRVRGLQSRAKNWNYQTACGEALSQAVADTLNDPDTRAYLEGK